MAVAYAIFVEPAGFQCKPKPSIRGSGVIEILDRCRNVIKADDRWRDRDVLGSSPVAPRRTDTDKRRDQQGRPMT